jgi:mono/diheme cytochrome c family protein
VKAKKDEDLQAKRKKRIPVPAKAALVWIGIYAFLKLVFAYLHMPLPASIMYMYMFTVTVGVLLAVSIFENTLKGFIDPILWFLRGDTARAFPWVAARWAFLVMVPLYVGYGVYQGAMPRFEPPITMRVIHPAPSPEVASFYNSLRDDEANLEQNIKAGARIYYQNCHYCHGDKWHGKGHFAHVFNPAPATFDETTIGMLQESYVFWRASTGGPGLPPESTPWDSAMPIWKDMLTDEEIWQVILYIYDATGNKPRTWE